MLESIIFHFIFVVFIIFAFVWWLATKRKCEQFKNSLIPSLLRNKFEFPQDRSLVVRSLGCLQEELSEFFHCKVNIEVQFMNLAFKSTPNFLIHLCSLQFKNKNDAVKSFLINETFYSSEELTSYVMLQKNRKHLFLIYDFDKNIWKMEIGNANTNEANC